MAETGTQTFSLTSDGPNHLAIYSLSHYFCPKELFQAEAKHEVFCKVKNTLNKLNKLTVHWVSASSFLPQSVKTATTQFECTLG